MVYDKIVAQIEIINRLESEAKSYRRDAGKLIRRSRARTCLSLREFAAKLDISPSLLCKIENDSALPSNKVLSAFSKWAKISRKDR